MKFNKYLNSLISFIVIIFLFTPLLSQELITNNEKFKNAFSFPATLSLRNLKTSQSFSISTFYNSQSKKSQYLTNFCNTFHYKLYPKLNLKLELNVVNYGNINTIDKYSLKGNTKILPNFQLDYYPNNDCHLRISLESFSTVFSPYQSIFPIERFKISDIE
ncbi:MAG: hypothetical protein KAW92_05035 [Candidatus Cloacimonetes bacterium]|nr:hypothetical protein [Candidatus Cloacimonadota bacterium]